jgi:hypothetical protein
MKEKLTINIASNNLIVLRTSLNLDTMKEIILYFKICTELIMSFIKSRLNRDNFWNLMFWLGVTLCVMLSEYFNDNKLFAGLSLWLGILGVPFIVKQMQDVKFDKKYGFFNASGRSLKDSMPMRWGFSIISSIGLIAIMRLINDKFSSDPNTSLSMVLYWSIFCLIPTLYFIYKNCPISILFNKHIIKRMPPEQLAAMNKFPSLSELRYSVHHVSHPLHHSRDKKH